MKIIGIALLISLFLFALIFGMDLLLKFDVKTSISAILTPIQIIDPVEIGLLTIFVFFFFALPLFHEYKKKKNKKKPAE